MHLKKQLDFMYFCNYLFVDATMCDIHHWRRGWVIPFLTSLPFFVQNSDVDCFFFFSFFPWDTIFEKGLTVSAQRDTVGMAAQFEVHASLYICIVNYRVNGCTKFALLLVSNSKSCRRCRIHVMFIKFLTFVNSCVPNIWLPSLNS